MRLSINILLGDVLKFLIILLTLFNYSTLASSVCGKIAEIRTPMDINNNTVQSVLVITRTDMITVVDDFVVGAVEKVLREKLSLSEFETYLYKQDYLDHLSERGFTICFEQSLEPTRTFPYPIIDRVKYFTIHHKTFVLFNSRKDEI